MRNFLLLPPLSPHFFLSILFVPVLIYVCRSALLLDLHLPGKKINKKKTLKLKMENRESRVKLNKNRHVG